MKDEQRKKEDRELIRDCFWRFKCRGLNAEEVIKQLDLEPKPKLELNRWIVDSNSPEWMWFYSESEQYGISDCGRWRKSYFTGIKPLSLPTERYATDEEILERLSKIAVEMGYKERQSECLWQLSSQEEIDLSSCVFELGSEGDLWIINDSFIEGYKVSNCIFKDGNWAKFIETDTERIERLEKRVKELENKNK